MGVRALPTLAQAALDGGVDPATPVALVEEGTLPGQRVTRARLDQVVDAAAAAGVRAPAVIVLGAVAAAGLLETPVEMPRAQEDTAADPTVTMAP